MTQFEGNFRYLTQLLGVSIVYTYFYTFFSSKGGGGGGGIFSWRNLQVLKLKNLATMRHTSKVI